SETPDGAGIHHHDAMRKWIEANIKFTVAYFRRRTGRRVKGNVTWRISLCLIGTAKPGGATTAGPRKYLDFDINCLASGLERYDLDRVMRCAVLEGSDTCNFGTVSARCRLEVSGCITSQITDDAFIDIQIVVRLSGPGIHPGKRDLNCRVAMGTRVACGKAYG